jgi:hypothetical protein
MAWETLYAFNGQRIDRRRVATGWEFWAEFPPPAGKRWLHSARPPEAIVIEAFEPLPGRPLKDVFADIRREAANQQAEAAREMARARWTDVLRPTPPRTHP